MTREEAIEILWKNRPTSDLRPCGMELCEAVDMAISALRQQDVADKDVGKWISVKDRLPDNKEQDWVLAQVVENNGFMHIPKVMEYRESKNDWFGETYGWLSKHNGAFTVTHWMPLPEPPEEGTV